MHVATSKSPICRGARTLVAFALAIVAAGTVAAGAAAAGEDADNHGGNTEPQARHGALTSAGSFYLEWWTEPERIPLNEMFTIHFRVLEPDDRNTKIARAAVTANAWMPEHGHGTTLMPRIESHRDGTATAHGFLLHMEGHWQLRVGVAVEGQMERATFDIQLDP